MRLAIPSAATGLVVFAPERSRTKRSNVGVLDQGGDAISGLSWLACGEIREELSSVRATTAYESLRLLHR